ncbi:DUF1648 domain-containing protein [Thermococcus sp.]|uniref:DUF1648 domain-containing protein n=1 Tax=Thermococcus sp. TaxID=35749 RepID=UPI00262240F7|nr:DUF1648 domain-containing protein [Thermococcus sp.]
MDTLEVFISITLLFAGLLTLAFRNRRQHFIGFRIGYTYMSREAWRRANALVGLFTVAFSLLLLLLAIQGIELNAFALVTVVGIFFILLMGTIVARRTYELEDLSTEADTGGEPIEVDVRPYLALQVVALALYLVLVIMLWDDLPERVAIHFDPSGKPDGFASKAVGALFFPLILQGFFIGMTFLLREPGFAPLMRFSRAGWRWTAKFFTLMAMGMAAVEAFVLLYNAGMVSGRLVVGSALVFLGLVFLGLAMGRRGKI